MDGVLEQLLVFLGIDVDDKGGKEADAAIEKIAGGMLAALGAAAALTRALFQLAESEASMGDEAEEAAVRMGMTVETVTALRAAVKFGGVDAGQLEVGIKKLNSTIDAASHGGKEAAKTLLRIGVSAQTLLKQTPEERLYAIADGLSTIKDAGERSALAVALLGRSGTALLPAFEHGAAGLGDLMRDAAELGGVTTGEQAHEMAEFMDQLDRLGLILSGIKRRIALDIIPAFRGWVDWIINTYKANKSFIDLNIDRTIYAIGRAIDWMRGPLGLLTIGIAAFSAWNAAGRFTAWAKTLGPISAELATMATESWAFLAPWLVWIGAAALAGLAAEDLWTAMKGGKSIAGEIAEAYGEGSEFEKTMAAMGSWFDAAGIEVSAWVHLLEAQIAVVDEADASLTSFTGTLKYLKDTWVSLENLAFHGVYAVDDKDKDKGDGSSSIADAIQKNADKLRHAGEMTEIALKHQRMSRNFAITGEFVDPQAALPASTQSAEDTFALNGIYADPQAALPASTQSAEDTTTKATPASKSGRASYTLNYYGMPGMSKAETERLILDGIERAANHSYQVDSGE